MQNLRKLRFLGSSEEKNVVSNWKISSVPTFLHFFQNWSKKMSIFQWKFQFSSSSWKILENLGSDRKKKWILTETMIFGVKMWRKKNSVQFLAGKINSYDDFRYIINERKGASTSGSNFASEKSRKNLWHFARSIESWKWLIYLFRAENFGPSSRRLLDRVLRLG